jgi:NodT family efflux transporter outer membrane factor (OMF) lipoprotein
MTALASAVRLALLPLLLGGCTVGPKYRRPPAPVPITSAYKEQRAVGTWKVASPSDAMLRGRWWEIFHEPELNALEERLNLDNQTIKQAFELYMAARAQIRVAQAGYYPTVGVSPNVTTSQSSSFGGGGGQRPVTTTFNAPVEASWAPDLWGRVRNAVRQAQYGAQISAADLESQRLLEQATLAQTFFQIRGQDALQELLDSTVETDERVLALTRSLYETGIGTLVAVVQSEQTLQAARVQATNVKIARAQFEHAVATLLGAPATEVSIPKRAELATPPPIPTGAPSQLLERRPDIAAAERAMAQANAVIGIGYAAYYPTLTLSGSAGFASSALATLFTWPSSFWSVGGNISQTVFDGGLRRATVDQLIAQYNATVAGYRQTVLTAFQQVEDFLAQAAILSQVIEEQKQNVALAQRAFELEKYRYETGLDPYLNLMTQQIILLSTRQTLVNLQVQEMISVVLLVQALGGGWERSDLPTPSQVSEKWPRTPPKLSGP